jgi:hypothetical protein
LSALGNDLLYHEFEYPQLPDKYSRKDQSYDDDIEENRNLEGAKTMVGRSVIHPHFKNVDSKGAEQYLDKRDVGEYIIRPSASASDQLTITIKFYDGLYVHIPIKELNKDNNWTLGKKLMIGEDTYEDLNDIIVNFITPYLSYAEELHQHDKYKPGRKDEVDRHLRAEKSKNKNLIPYRFGLAYEHPGRFVLYYLPKDVIRREHISITPKGFRLRDKDFTKARRLVEYFKRNWSNVNQQPKRKDPTSVSQTPPQRQSQNITPRSNQYMVPISGSPYGTRGYPPPPNQYSPSPNNNPYPPPRRNPIPQYSPPIMNMTQPPMNRPPIVNIQPIQHIQPQPQSTDIFDDMF